MFNNNYLNNKESVKIGKQVVASGTLGIYSPRGQYQFKSYSIKQLGDGDLWKKFELNRHFNKRKTDGFDCSSRLAERHSPAHATHHSSARVQQLLQKQASHLTEL